MLRQLNGKSITIGSIISIVSVWMLLVAMGLVTTYRNQARSSANEARVEQLSNRMDVAEKTIDLRLTQLERFVFATLPEHIQTPSSTRPRVPAESWQKNRDEEIQKRLRALEDWRLQQSIKDESR